MERHLRGRRARRRLTTGALCGAWLAAACVPLAPFSRPPPEDGVSAPAGADGTDAAPALPPDLPEPGDDVASPAAPAAPASPAPTEELAAPSSPAAEVSGETASEAEASPAAAPTGDPLRSEVRGVLESFYAAYNAREWKRARTHFWDGATITDVRIVPDHPAPVVRVSSVAEFFDELARVRESGPEGFEGRLEGAPEVRIASNVAQAWCLFQASFGGPRESMSWRRVDAFTFVLHEGTWKIASLSQSSSFDVPDTR
jgi:hypothetical protein